MKSLISHLNSLPDMTEFQIYLKDFPYFSVDSIFIHHYTL